MTEVKIFGIGLQKTGTSSLGRALTKLGYNIDERTAYDLMDLVVEGDYEEAVRKRVSEYDGFEDTPWPAIYRDLDQWFPGSKFILTERAADGWIVSMNKHFADKPNSFKKWFYGKSAPLGNEELYKEKFADHNKSVKEYFSNRPNDLLIIDFEKGQGWKEICEFMGKPAPNEDFPHLNKNKTIWDKLGHKYHGAIRRVKKVFGK